MNTRNKYILVAIIVIVLAFLLGVTRADATEKNYCYEEPPEDYCETLEGIQNEDEDCPKECIPNDVVWVLAEDEEYCEEEPPVPTPVPTPPGNPPTFSGSSTDAPGVCPINNIGNVANIYVKTTDNKSELEVQWSLPENADQVHIEYGLGQSAEHALLNTPNDGNEVIRNLKSGEHYWFRVAGVRECGVGNYSNWFDPIVP